MKNTLFSTKSSTGFTLIEVMVTSMIIALVGLILGDILTKSFQNSSKVKLVSNIKQNGQSSLNIIDNTLRSSGSIGCVGNYPSVSYPNTTMVLKSISSGKVVRFRIHPESSLGPNKNGNITQELLNIDPNDLQALQSACSDADSNLAKVITDDTSQNAVSIKSGSFEKLPPAGAKDTIVVHFEIGPPYNAGPGFESQIGGEGTVKFQTTIQLR